MATNIVPTLLIGLGGIGSKIVEKVYEMVPPERRELIAAHAFDTDINDISKRVHLKGQITQTSKAITVGDYLRRANESVKEWFPHEIKLLHKKTLTEGAGQIRSVSRLAYRAAMEDGKFDGLERQISKIFKARGETTVSSVRVMIVTSLSGGTGAGIFLQTALYLREILKKDFAKSSVLVRGAFLLPDILVNTKTVPENQVESIRANAYACFKELDAITMNASSQSTESKRTVNIEFEYRPDQVDIEGRPQYVITSNHLPYDFCFLYDYFTGKNEQIGSLDNYEEQMVRTIYLQLFSPISSRNFSVEDNFIIDLIKEDGANRYCTAGTASLIYPYDDIVEYLALKWAAGSMSGEWRRIDDDFENELRQYEDDKLNGVNREAPNMIKRYVEILNSYIEREQPDPFFNQIYKSARILDDKGREIGTKAEKFIEAIEANIIRVLEADEELKQDQRNCEIDETKVKKEEKAKAEVQNMEDCLDIFKQKVFSRPHEIRNTIVNKIIGEDCRSADVLSGDEDYRLNVWMLARQEPLHPVAVRYVLYQIKNILLSLSDRLSAENTKIKRGIEHYEQVYNRQDKEENKEDAIDRINDALKQSRLKKLLKNEFKQFIEEYLSESAQQLQRLIRYKIDFLRELVFKDLLKAVNKMIEVWEHYFRSLKEIQDKLIRETASKAEEHEGESNPTKRYVLARKEYKEKIWDDLRGLMSIGSKLPSEISKSIYIGQYIQFCGKHFKYTEYRQTAGKVEDMFRRDVINWYRDTIKKQERIDIDIISAIRKEAALREIDELELLKDEIAKVSELASPCIFTTSSNSQSNAYWGIHPECIEQLSGDQKENLFGEQNPIEDKAFSRYEIIRYRNLCGMMAEDIPAFSAGFEEEGGGGEYFLAYTKRIKAVNSPNINAVTPHLDKRWHLPAYMPDLNKKIGIEDEKKIDRAFLLGLIYGRLVREKPDRDEIWECNTNAGRKSVMVGGKNVDGTFYALYKAMYHNPSHVDSIHEYASETRKEETKKHTERAKVFIDRHSFYKGCLEVPKLELNIIDSILSFMVEEPSIEGIDKEIDNLIYIIMEEIRRYLLKVYGKNNENESKKEAGSLIKTMAEDSEKLKELKDYKDGYLYKGWLDIINTYLDKTLNAEKFDEEKTDKKES